ncbi:unnamed protein product [Clonostachys rosea f. rosea IK726]|jgi:hypothetical protein|uniref:Uncharacterized protein n=1 Tax=Clonostachys rosea f. rosea IK726 TaxID=1349383 RepID=A0ACA9UU20_BIOOC|nr:unnamed protein product [Clonostachys rosea f. rosea IK726]
MKADPLAGVDQIPWSDVDHAYGEATDLPETLRNLQSPDEDIHQGALYSLYGSICHQGSRYTSTPLAIPFLYRLIDSPDTPARGELLLFMACLAFGLNSDELPLGTDVARQRQRLAELREDPNRAEIIKKGLDEFLGDAIVERNREYLQSYIKSLRASGAPEDEANWWSPEVRSYNAVQNGLDTAYRCLKDDSTEVRTSAAYLLAWFPDRLSDSEQHLMEMLDCEQTATAQATAVISLATLQAMKEDFSETRIVRRLRDIQSRSSSCLVTWASSLALVKLRVNTEKGLSEAMKLFADEEDQYPERLKEELEKGEFPFLNGRPSTLKSLAARELQHFKGSKHPEMVKAITSATASSRGMDLVTLSSALLNIAFDGVKPGSEPDFDCLSDLQQEVMQALNTRLEKRFEFGNFMTVLESWNLPTRAEDFEVFIKHPDAFQSRL